MDLHAILATPSPRPSTPPPRQPLTPLPQPRNQRRCLPPQTPKSCRHCVPDLTRDERLQVKTLRAAGFTLREIESLLKITPNQAQYAAFHAHPVTPRKKTGRPPLLTKEQADELEAFVCSSRQARQMSYLALSLVFKHWGVSEYAIRYALYKRGYRRYVARQKPPLSEANRKKRLEWAREHVHWTYDQWCLILWSDESWVTEGRHRKMWVTRRAGEELEPTCIVDKIQKRKGWMFWGCFNGTTKGPSLFWEKEWGSINSESYCERILPLIHGWIRLNPGLLFMQDSAPGHTAQSTIQELRERGISPIFWPPFSPDLNPIETIWNWMKDYIENKYGDVRMGYDQLRAVVKEAWDAISPYQLHELVASMPARCQAVIDAEGGYTKF